jgi:TPR repeat protein
MRRPESQYEPDDINGGPRDENDDFFGASNHGPSEVPFPDPGQSSVATGSLRAPSPPPGPILDHSHLRPGTQAALQSHERTLEQYRANAKKTQDPELQFEFAVFMIDASKSFPIPALTHSNVIEVEKAVEKREDLIREATSLLKRLADRGHPASQYFLADCYANGIGTTKSKQDFDRAYPLFVLAAKHAHPDAAYRAGTCCENGWGCRRESGKSLQFYRKAGAAQHPGAMYRLGIAELNGELGLSKRPKEGVKWLKRSAEHATAEFPHALHELALLHEKGLDTVLFVDFEYSVELLAQAAELGYAPSAYKLGECYEYGKMGCPQDPALSIHYYVRLSFSSSSSKTYCILEEYRSTTKPSGRMFCIDSMVSSRFTRRSTTIRHRSFPVGTEGCGGWVGQGHVRCGVFLGSRDWDNGQYDRVSGFLLASYRTNTFLS